MATGSAADDRAHVDGLRERYDRLEKTHAELRVMVEDALEQTRSVHDDVRASLQIRKETTRTA